MARISKAPEERRQEIIDTAYRLFTENGYEQTAVRDIVRELGVAQGLFYYYFKSKEDVLLAAVEKMGHHLLERIAQIIADTQTPPLERIREAFAEITEFLSHGHATILRPPLNTQLRAQFEQNTRRLLLPYLNELLREGVANGDFTVPYPAYTVRFVLAGFIGLFMDEQCPTVEESMPTIEALIERILALPQGTLSLSSKE